MIWLEQVDKELQVTAQETSSTKVFVAFSKLLFFPHQPLNSSTEDSLITETLIVFISGKITSGSLTM